jgi:hypothetical protein
MVQGVASWTASCEDSAGGGWSAGGGCDGGRGFRRRGRHRGGDGGCRGGRVLVGQIRVAGPGGGLEGRQCGKGRRHRHSLLGLEGIGPGWSWEGSRERCRELGRERGRECDGRAGRRGPGGWRGRLGWREPVGQIGIDHRRRNGGGGLEGLRRRYRRGQGRELEGEEGVDPGRGAIRQSLDGGNGPGRGRRRRGDMAIGQVGVQVGVRLYRRLHDTHIPGVGLGYGQVGVGRSRRLGLSRLGRDCLRWRGNDLGRQGRSTDGLRTGPRRYFGLAERAGDDLGGGSGLEGCAAGGPGFLGRRFLGGGLLVDAFPGGFAPCAVCRHDGKGREHHSAQEDDNRFAFGVHGGGGWTSAVKLIP